MRTVVDWVDSVLKGWTLLCTGCGDFRLNNVSIPDSPFVRMFPKGFYRNVLLISDDFEANAIKVVADVALSK